MNHLVTEKLLVYIVADVHDHHYGENSQEPEPVYCRQIRSTVCDTPEPAE